MKRNKRSQQQINNFMNGYSSFIGMPTLGGVPMSSGGAASLNILKAKMQYFTGDGKKVRLFEHCIKDNSFMKGYMSEVLPMKNRTVRFKLGKYGQTTNNTLSAIYIPKGYDVVLHEYSRSNQNFLKGKHKILRKSSGCLADVGWNDMVSEIDVLPQGSWLTGMLPWQSQIQRQPVQTVGQYNQGGRVVKPGVGGPMVAPDGVRVVNVRPNRPVIPGKPFGPPGKPGINTTDKPLSDDTRSPQNETPTGVAAEPFTPTSTWSPSDNGTAAAPSTAPPSATPTQTKAPTTPATPTGKADEEKSIWKNPVVWGGIIIVVIGLIYIMKPTKTVATTKASSKKGGKKAKHGMKVKSGRTMKMKHGGHHKMSKSGYKPKMK